MLDAMIAYLWPEGLVGLTQVGSEADVRTGQMAQDLVFKTLDGYITCGAVSDAEWRGMCEALQKPEWLDDPRYNTPRGRVRNARERLAATAEVIATRSSDEWLARLDAQGVPCAPVLARREMVENEQIKANEILYEYEHPGMGRIRQSKPAARFSDTPTSTRQHAPFLGQHGTEILRELDFTREQILELQSDGVLLQESPPA